MNKLIKRAIWICFFVFAMFITANAAEKGYSIRTGNTRVYSNVGLTKAYGWIYDTDEVIIKEIKPNYLKVTYPISKGTKTGYVSPSAFLLKYNGWSSYISQSKITTYRRPNGSSYGYISKGDKVYILGNSGGFTQVKYPVSGGYKFAFVKSSTLSNQSSSTSKAPVNQSVNPTKTLKAGTALIISGAPETGSQLDMNRANTVISNYAIVRPRVTITEPFDSLNRNDRPTKEQFKKWIKNAYAITDNDSISYFYFSGHSWNSAIALQCKKVNIGIGKYDLQMEESISYYDLAQSLCDYAKGTVVVIMDACHSGKMADIVRSSTTLSKRLVVIAACAADESSNATKNDGGFFTKQLYAGFANNYLRGEIKSNNLYDYIVSSYVVNKTKQTFTVADSIKIPLFKR